METPLELREFLKERISSLFPNAGKSVVVSGPLCDGAIVTIVFDSKETWINNIWQNAKQYLQFHISPISRNEGETLFNFEVIQIRGVKSKPRKNRATLDIVAKYVEGYLERVKNEKYLIPKIPLALR